MTFLADPHEIPIPIKWWKNQPSSTSASGSAQYSRYAHSEFWPVFAQKCFGFCNGKFFPLMGITCNFQGSISTTRRTFEPKTSPAFPLKPHLLAKNVLFMVQNTLETFRVFVKRPIKPVGKIFRTQKTDCQNLFSSRSYKSLKFEFVCSRICPW